MIIEQLNRRICPQGATRGETPRRAFPCNWTFVTRELLDAAHIIPDNMPEGKSTIENGLSLCKLHHSAYDAFIIGVTLPFPRPLPLREGVPADWDESA